MRANTGHVRRAALSGCLATEDEGADFDVCLCGPISASRFLCAYRLSKKSRFNRCASRRWNGRQSSAFWHSIGQLIRSLRAGQTPAPITLGTKNGPGHGCGVRPGPTRMAWLRGKVEDASGNNTIGQIEVPDCRDADTMGTVSTLMVFDGMAGFQTVSPPCAGRFAAPPAGSCAGLRACRSFLAALA